MGKKQVNWLKKCAFSIILIASILFSENLNGITASAESAFFTSYYVDMSDLEVDDYDDYSLTISWYSKGTNSGFAIYRRTEFQTEYELLGTVANEQYNLLTFKDDGFRRGLIYYYKVVAYEETEDQQIELKTVIDAWKLNINKVEIKSVKRKSGGKAKLVWLQSYGVDGYEIYKKTAGGSYKRVKRVSGEKKLTYTLSSISTKKKTYYKIRGYVKQSGKYAYGDYSSVKTLEKVETSAIAIKFKKLQKKYPNGKYWNHVGKRKFTSATITTKPCHHSAYDGLADTCNYYYCPDGVIGYQCYGFAWKMSDLIYGKKAKIKNFYSFSKCKAGDVIRHNGHSMIVVSKYSGYITVGECNYGDTCIIKWGRKVYKSELIGAKYSRRYK